jgi:hypothetical protein
MLWWEIEEDMGIDKMPGNWKAIRKVRLRLTMHHRFRPPLFDLKSQKYQNSSLFHQLL